MTLLHQISRRFPDYQFSISYIPPYESTVANREMYTITHSGRVFSIKAGSELAKYYALSRLQIALQAGRVLDVVGTSQPRVGMRSLVITKTARYRLPSQLEVDLPDWFDSIDTDEVLLEKTHDLLLFLFDVGVNALLFLPSTTEEKEPRSMSIKQISWKSLRLFLDFMREQGIKVGLTASYPSQNKVVADRVKEYADAVGVLYNACDSLVILQGSFAPTLPDQDSQDKIEYERVRDEIRVLESIIKKPIVYFLSCKTSAGEKAQAIWVERLLDEVSSTTIAFHTHCQEPYSFSLDVHPLIQLLSRRDAPCQGKLMPLISLSMFHAGSANGVPSIAPSAVEQVFGCRHELFLSCAGMMVEEAPPLPTASMPSTVGEMEVALLRAAAFAYGQRLWSDHSVDVLYSKALAAFLPSALPLWGGGLFTELELLLRHYGIVKQAGFRHRQYKRPLDAEYLKIEFVRLAHQLQQYYLCMKSINLLITNYLDDNELLFQLFELVHQRLYRLLEEEAQASSLKIPPFLTHASSARG